MPSHSKISLVKDGELSYKAFWNNGVFIGDVLTDVDGYYKWFPPKGLSGYYDQMFLQMMHEVLYDLNKEWDNQIHEYFSNRHGKHDMEHGEPI